MLGKTFKGMTDDLLRWETEALQAVEDRRTDWTVHVRPEVVVEVGFNEIQVSPRAGEADTIDTVRAIPAGERRLKKPTS